MNTADQIALARFESKFTPEPYSGCWLWDGSCSQYGYGDFWFRGKLGRAHRASWVLYNGEIPDGLKVLHRCDTPECVNPAHLFLGTLSDNNLDSVRKGRYNRPSGESHYRCKLTDSQVKEIRSSAQIGSELAARFGVSQRTIHRIKDGTRRTKSV